MLEGSDDNDLSALVYSLFLILIENKEPGLYLSDANYDELWQFGGGKPFKRPGASDALGKIGVAVNQSKIWKCGSDG